MNTKKSVIEILFDSYVEGGTVLNSTMDKEKSELYNEFYDAISEAGVDAEMLVDLDYITMKAAFYAGFNAAKSLLSVRN